MIPVPAQSQSPFVIRAPHWEWRTVELPHWVVHYPAQAQRFADCLAPRLESIHRQVASLVGYAGHTKTILVITDAQSLDGAYASANSRAPVIVLQAQPSAPRTAGWSDCASARLTHELTHILQLSRPWTRSHSTLARAGLRLLPAAPGPVVFRRKPWLRESYAEHVEGLLTPTGAPYTTPRSDAIRRLARTGQWPAYTALDATYEGRYLVGAAFVDELANRAGDSAFARLWERMAAPDWRGHDVEMARLFGARPESLYARFSARAAALGDTVDARIHAAGIVSGLRVRRIGHSDFVAVSPDGSTMAAVYGSPLLRLTLSTSRDSSTPFKRFPVPTGQSPNSPRFTPDGKRIVFVAWELIADGVWRPDVFEWDIAGNSFRRVTRGSGIREIDPAPDGVSAVATRCDFGICDLVRVNLRDGSATVLAQGSPSLMFSRPRVSRTGEIVVAVQSGARSRIAIVGGNRLSYFDPDDGAWRYQPAWLRDGRVVVVSDATGIPALEIIDPRTGARSALTRTLEPAYAPEADPISDSVYYVLATPEGSVVHKVALADASERFLQLRDSSLSPATPVKPGTFPVFPRDAGNLHVRPYGLGPRFLSVVPSGSWTADGAVGGLQVWSSDIVGRLSVMGTAHFGQRATLRGYGATGVLRSMRLPLVADLALVEQTFRTPPPGPYAHLDYAGGALRTEWNRGPWARRQSAMLGGALGRVDLGELTSDRLTRAIGAASYGIELTQVGEWYASERSSVSASGGVSDETAFARWTASARLEVGTLSRGRLFAVNVTGGALSGGAPAFERFAVGGVRPTLVGELSLMQRIPQPLVPTAALTGRHVLTTEVTGPEVRLLTPFVWAAAADSLRNRQGVAGLSWSFVDEPRRNWRVPGIQLRASAGYGFWRYKGLRAQVSLSYSQ